LKLKFNIQIISIGWIISGIVTQIISLFSGDQKFLFAGIIMTGLGVVLVWLDYWDWKKKNRDLRSNA